MVDSRSTGAPQRAHLMDSATLRRNYEQRLRAEQAAREAGREVPTTGETIYVTDRDEGSGGMSLNRVRELVISVLVVTTLFHFSVGLALLGVLSDDRPEQVALNLTAVATGLLMVAAARLIHGLSLRTWWMALGPVIGVGGLVWALFF